MREKHLAPPALRVEKGFFMKNRLTQYNKEGFQDAVRRGYKISSPWHLTEQINSLCRSLGQDYHAARVGGWNAAHQVIGDGWSEAVYPTANGRDYYVVELWRDHCSEQVARVHGIGRSDISRILNLLKRKYIDMDPMLSDIAWNPEWIVQDGPGGNA